MKPLGKALILTTVESTDPISTFRPSLHSLLTARIHLERRQFPPTLIYNGSFVLKHLRRIGSPKSILVKKAVSNEFRLQPLNTRKWGIKGTSLVIFTPY